MEARMFCQPRLDLGMLVGGVVVGDQMQVELLGRLGVDTAQEFQPFLMAVPLHAVADDLAGGDVERGEQCRRAVALVVMRHGAGSALLDRQAGLCAVERLDLALLVDRENQRLVRRIEIETDDIAHLLDEVLVIRQLEGLHQVRLEAVRLPDPLHAGVGEADGTGHLADAPMRRRLRRLVQGLMHNPLDHLGAQRRLASRSRRIAAQSGDAFGKVALLPAPHRHLTFADQPDDRHRADPVSRQQHYPCPPNQLLRRVPPRNQPFQRRPLRGRQPDACQCLRHSPRIAERKPFGKLLLGSEQ